MNHFADTWKWGNGPNDKQKKFAWTSGGFGTLVSNPVMKAMVENINKVIFHLCPLNVLCSFCLVCILLTFLQYRDALPGKMFDHGNDVETGACLTFLGFEPVAFKTYYGGFLPSSSIVSRLILHPQ